MGGSKARGFSRALSALIILGFGYAEVRADTTKDAFLQSIEEMFLPALEVPEAASFAVDWIETSTHDTSCPFARVRIWVHDADRPIVGHPAFLRTVEPLAALDLAALSGLPRTSWLECANRQSVRLEVWTGYQTGSRFEPVAMLPHLALEDYLRNLTLSLVSDESRFDVSVASDCGMTEKIALCTYVRGRVQVAPEDLPILTTPRIRMALETLFHRAILTKAKAIFGDRKFTVIPAFILELGS